MIRKYKGIRYKMKKSRITKKFCVTVFYAGCIEYFSGYDKQEILALAKGFIDYLVKQTNT
jgi:hypothetical protein